MPKGKSLIPIGQKIKDLKKAGIGIKGEVSFCRDPADFVCDCGHKFCRIFNYVWLSVRKGENPCPACKELKPHAATVKRLKMRGWEVITYEGPHEHAEIRHQCGEVLQGIWRKIAYSAHCPKCIIVREIKDLQIGELIVNYEEPFLMISHNGRDISFEIGKLYNIFADGWEDQ